MADVFACLIMLSPFVMAGVAFVVLFYQDRATLPKLKFKDFKKFYELNPNRWGLSSSYVSCDVGDNYRTEVFAFSLMDYFRYKLWRYILNKNKTNAEHTKSTQLMLDAVKEDIAKAKEKETTNMIDLFTKELKNVPSLIKALEKHGVCINVKEK